MLECASKIGDPLVTLDEIQDAPPILKSPLLAQWPRFFTRRREYGIKGAREATEILTRASALFAGGELDEEAKDIFFQSLMEVYLESKEEARSKFGGKKRASRSRKAAEK